MNPAVIVGLSEVQLVLLGQLKLAKHGAIGEADHASILVNAYDATVEAHMIGRAKAQDVRYVIRPVVRMTHWPDMRSLGVRAGRRLERQTTDLTSVAIQPLDPV